jgi:tRNA A-37 threonylcarbamoyl transferase component Bud32
MNKRNDCPTSHWSQSAGKSARLWLNSSLNVHMKPDAEIQGYLQRLLDATGLTTGVEIWCDESTGVANYVYQIRDLQGDSFYLKHGPRVPRNSNLKGIDPNRISVEHAALTLLNQIRLPDHIHLPQILHFDGDNQILVISDACPKGGKNLQDVLLKTIPSGTVWVNQLATFLSHIHKTGPLASVKKLQTSVSDSEHWEKWLSLRTSLTVSSDNKNFPTQFEEWTGISRQALSIDLKQVYTDCDASAKPGFVLIDPSPKNFLIGKDDLGVIDFELACAFGDRAYDIGCLLGQIIILVVSWSKVSSYLWRAVQNLYGFYQELMPLDLLDHGFEKRTIRIAGAMLLYRSIGIGKGSYITDPCLPHLCRLGVSLIREGPRAYEIEQLFTITKEKKW